MPPVKTDFFPLPEFTVTFFLFFVSSFVLRIFNICNALARYDYDTIDVYVSKWTTESNRAAAAAAITKSTVNKDWMIESIRARAHAIARENVRVTYVRA